MSRYVTNKGSWSGDTRVSGLPYACNGSTSAISVSHFPDAQTGTGTGTRAVVGGAVESAQTYLYFTIGARMDTRHQWADLGTGYYLNCQGSYMTNS
jgi:hypothetical protein